MMSDLRSPEELMHALNMEKAKELIRGAGVISVLTGAGVSAESGVSTFRDADTGALWDKFDPEKLSSMSGFEEDPTLVWEWYITRIKQVVESAKPNPGHVALGKLESLKPTTVITQNVDDLHECGGSHDVLHLHGDIKTARCFAGCGWSDDVGNLDLEAGQVPACPSCGAIARPNVVWFGEMLDETVVGKAISALEKSDLCIVAGTSGQVYPAAGMPWYASRNGGKIISINTRRSDHCQYADVCLTGKFGEIMAQLVDDLYP